ncbi:hypothetical protein [Mesorhizobium sp. M00.F.Ca.ET.216.01.1.1]|uniref:hypothetical protein n=1 Tax=Mesorhizobium sp. M00.F.Ca.ET.216.01.1.1 TaxID=2500528 RepID=UPI000FD830F8|nr:hypothetical protein [Mesorhizobium sp. M00.F.Ca.ET.216.01.1.1]TGQ42023.1 hypothetical protein EN859_011565 [Mesorhizobium sp. M00.F.Ca.ET.216.01.1.1]
MHKSVERIDTRTSPLVSGSIAFLSVLLFACLAVRILNYELRLDEELFVPPIRLLENHRLYLDFFYNHPPGSAWWFYGVRKLTGSDYLLLSGRLGVLAGWLLLAASIGIVSFALTRSGVASWCIVVLSLANELFLAQTGVAATNNLLPLPFLFLGLGLFILGVNHDRTKPVLVALAGFCLSVAGAFKISAVAFIPPVAIAAFLMPRPEGIRHRVMQVVVPLTVGGLVGALPILTYLIADPARFLAHVLGYHLGPHAQYFQMLGADDDHITTLSGKLKLASGIWLDGSVAVPLAALLTLLITTQRWTVDRRRGHWLLPSGSMAIVLGALVLAIVFSFIPTPSYPQYFAPPLVCLPLALALLFARLMPDARKNVQPALTAATIIVLAMAAPRLVQHLGTVIRPEKWTVMRVHAEGVAIAERLAAAHVSGKVATLSPIYPLEGGLDVYPELATGPFAYRTADIAAPETARYYRMTSSAQVGALLDADSPAALLLGFDQTLEQPLLAYAKKNGYAPVPGFAITDRYGTGTLYVRSGAAE